MWFLIQNRIGGVQWFCVEVSRWNLDTETVKRHYRNHGLPIIAIARLKPRPHTDREYD